MTRRCRFCDLPVKWCVCSDRLAEWQDAEEHERLLQFGVLKSLPLQGDDALDASLLGPSVDAQKAFDEDARRLVLDE